MRAVDGEAERRSPDPMLQPSLDHVGDQRLLIHRLAEVAFVVVAGNSAHTLQVRMCGREHLEAGQNPGADQLVRCGRND